MLNIIRRHPYILSLIVVLLLLFFIGIFALDFSWSDSLFAAAVLAAIGVGAIWWMQEGLG